MGEWDDRKRPDLLLLFDVDGTLTPARRSITPEMLELLKTVRKEAVIGFVGGSDLVKQQEQLGPTILEDFDFAFSENGLMAYKKGELIASQSFIGWIGEEKYKKLVNFILRYIADLDLPIKRGTFIEFRKGMINVSPVGRNCTVEERNDYEKYDKLHSIRPKLVEALKKEFHDYSLTFSIGGQISIDIFPTGWDKTYCMQYVKEFKEIHFFGDKTYKGGNDYEIYNLESIKGHAVNSPDDTMKEVKALFPHLFKTS
ncbi:7280_t:CDS:10 [Scutellospora calospora]|uniref:7280_t:CDS:1 n=1 Tax=Scutellospora calospora TaxID=85575 RepID=A0ACA9KNC4_9GLOM|nr:7280_t:CDS:10 [Scutellospora calospora]